MFITALFTTAKRCKQPKFPLTEELIKKMYIYTMENYSAYYNFNSNYIVIWVGLINNSYRRQMLTMKEESFGAGNNT